jgi:hypothetical protein
MKIIYCAVLALLTSCASQNGVTPAPEGAVASSSHHKLSYTPLWSNGQQIPASFGNTNFGASGPLYQGIPPLPTGATLAPVQTGLQYYFTGNPAVNIGWVDGNSSQGQYDYNFPVYQGGSNDQTVTIHCASGGTCSDNGTTIQLPIWAAQAGGSDHHLAVLEAATGIEYDFWGVSSNPPYTWLENITASNESKFNINGTNNGGYYVSPGFEYYASTAGGIGLSGGEVYISELQQGIINHALNLTFSCGTNSYVYPATQTSGQCSGGNGIPLGSRVWLSLSRAAIWALPVSKDMQTILVALHEYGGFYTDSGGGSGVNGSGTGFGVKFESQEPYWIWDNGSDPVSAYAIANSWPHVVNGSVNRYDVGSIGGSYVNLYSYLKLVAPCETQNNC